MDLQQRKDIDQYLQQHLQDTVFDMELSIDYTNRSITASYETFYFDEDTSADPTFSPTILDHIQSSPMTGQQICDLAHVDYRVITRSKAKSSYKPSKSIVLALGIALQLSEDSMVALLGSAGYDLSTVTKRDLILRYFMEHQIYEVAEINHYLDHYKELQLGSC